MDYEISIIAGSKASDKPVIDASGIRDILAMLKIGYTISYISAHKNRQSLEDYLFDSKADVFILAAGRSAALPGDAASILRTVPVLGVALPSDEFPGATDAMLSMIQMPYPIPVCFMGIGRVGLKNAAIAAIQILAVRDPLLRGRLEDFLGSEIRCAAVCDEVYDPDRAQNQTT